MAKKNIAQADPVKEVEEIQFRALTVFGSNSDSDIWFSQPRKEFDYCAAAELLHTDIGRELVKLALSRLESEAADSQPEGRGCRMTLCQRAPLTPDSGRWISP